MTGKNVEQTPSLQSQLELAPLVVNVTILPRFARRLRCLAAKEGRSVSAVAARLIACAIVPDPKERRRLVDFDLRDAGGTP